MRPLVVQELPHGYTNDTRGDGAVVVKRFQGPDAADRRHREHAILGRLHGRLPVPPLLDGSRDDELRMGFVRGSHGQRLIELGYGAAVSRACGETLRRIHGLNLIEVLPHEASQPGVVLVHGDYGPNNLLFDPGTFSVTAILDWEWAHAGRPVEDLAWCEWIVRMHHREHVETLDEFFAGYGHRPTWAERQEAMLAQCQSLLELCQRWTPDGEAVHLWQRRVEVTAAWTE